MSSANEIILEILRRRGAHFVSSAHVDEAAGAILLTVPIELLEAKADSGVTSRRQLANLSQELEAATGMKTVVSYVTSQQLLDIETGLRAILQRRYSNEVANLFLSFSTGTTADARVLLIGPVDEELREAIRSQVREHLTSASIELLALEFTATDASLPSLVALLRAVKAHAPVKVPQLVTHLHNAGYDAVTEDWLSRRLDTARRQRFVIRAKQGAYSMTGQGLEVIPSTRASRSSDIGRMLLLAKREEW